MTRRDFRHLMGLALIFLAVIPTMIFRGQDRGAALFYRIHAWAKG